ncbi:hypothetical protein FRUB_01507 [Fimbriiglobus ruber]|uniref:Uncharacterized protein n=1 Tax=Fimbriiglobus ruber TaxID=1908690 RepID=A0A225E4Z9_9BACT|nr:hypothetical protein FRUB_01507 [Fimbriiglobus ruber]
MKPEGRRRLTSGRPERGGDHAPDLGRRPNIVSSRWRA